MQLITPEEFKAISLLTWSNSKVVFDVTRNKIIATNWYVVIFMEVNREERQLAEFVDQSCSIPLERISDIRYIDSIVFQEYIVKPWTSRQLLEPDVNIWYIMGGDKVLLDDWENYESTEMVTIENLLDMSEEADKSLFDSPERQPKLQVTKGKILFDKIIEKINRNWTEMVW